MHRHSRQRARQIATGGKEAMVDIENDKPTVLALREIAEGLVGPAILNEPTTEEKDVLAFSAVQEGVAQSEQDFEPL